MPAGSWTANVDFVQFVDFDIYWQLDFYFECSGTFTVTWINNITDVHSAVKKGLFWGKIRKDGYSLMVGKEVIDTQKRVGTVSKVKTGQSNG